MITKVFDRNLVNLSISIFQQVGIQIINLVFQVFLARMLSPEDFGLIGVLMVFYALGIALSEMGMNFSLIRSKELTNNELNTIFISIVSISLLIYLGIYLLAPSIAKFYTNSNFALALRVYGLTIVTHTCSSIYIALLTKRMNFKRQLFVELLATFLSGVIGLFMAMSGFGFWSLVILYLSRSSMKSLLYMVLEDKWKPRIYWSFSLFNRHIVYGFKITSSTLIGTSTNNLLPILISNYFGLSFLGYYSQGNSLARIIYTNVNAGINKVFFAFFSNRDEKSDIKISKYLIVLSVVSFFVVISSLCFGEKLILMLYGKKWSDSIFIFIKLTIGLSLLPTVTYMLSFLNTNGFENYVLKLNLIRRSMLLLIVFFGAIFLKFEDFISLFSFAFYLDNVLVISSCLIKIKVESLVVLSEFSMLVNTALLLVIGVCSAYLLNIFIESTPYRIIVTLLMFLLFCYFNYQRFESLNKME